MLPDPYKASQAPAPLEVASEEQLARLLEVARSLLSDREKAMIQARFGQRDMTLEEVGRAFAVTRERIRSMPPTISSPGEPPAA